MTQRLTREVEGADPPAGRHRSVMVDVQVRHPLVVLLQHQEHRVQEVDQLADVEDPASVGQPYRLGVVTDLDG